MPSSTSETSGIIEGIDVSNAQGDVDWAAVRGGGFQFGIAKATEGVDYQDARFAPNLQAIARLDAGAGFLPGAYHFGRPDHHAGRSGGEREAQWFCQILRAAVQQAGLSLERNFLPPVLDMETYDKSGATDNIAWVEGFLSVVASETGRTAMIYTGPNYWRYQMADTDQFAAKGVPLWQATYRANGADPSATPPAMIKDTSKTQWTASLWQWSGGGDFNHYGTIPGIADGIADVDRLMGDASLLATLGATSGAPATTKSTSTAATRSDPSADPSADPSSSPASLPDFASTVDLRELRGGSSPITARVQGLLLSHGYGPRGLLSSHTGLPDGTSGPTTEGALAEFKAKAGLSRDTVVDDRTWWTLVTRGLR